MTTFRLHTLLWPAFLGLMGAGAGVPAIASTSAAAPASAPAASASGIAWYTGSVESAFQLARAQDKPVFLDWGATWCPPCQELQATVFRQPDFIAKLKLFVPVHLDGDDPGAQRWGDKFGVSGYPTVLVLKPDGTELARIEGGMDLSQYAEVLDLALGDVRPVKAVLAAVDAGTRLSRDDCRRLAWYAWDLTDDAINGGDATERRLSSQLQRAAGLCPAASRGERARLILSAAGFEADAEADALKAGKPPSAHLAALAAKVYAILGNRPQAVEVADALESLDQPFFTAAVRTGRPAAAWRERYAAVMEAAAADGRYSVADHLYFLYARIVAEKALTAGHAVPAALAATAHRRIDATLARPLDEYTRTSVVNAALNILDQLGDDDRAYAILRQQMAISKSPYYYMPDIAELEEKRGHVDAAIAWLARGYHESRGEATRFQWGTDYVLGLVRMRPTDEARIRDAALAVLGELDGPDRIYRRTRIRLMRLEKSLRQWNHGDAHEAAIAALRARMSGICAKIPAAESAHSTCTDFLARA
ncbi:MAG TPA: thioredoxin family protein [Steroidobacteraceae bacterium]|nr:thioredoxin family protein [Steroidobacteraceae bacterium]